MRKRRIYLALVGFGIVIGGIVLFSRPEPEPEDRGVPLSRLVDGLIGRDQPVSEENSLKRIGTNAIPYLLKWLQYEQPAWKGALYYGINFVLYKVNTDWRLRDHRDVRASFLSEAFLIVDPTGARSVPELTRLANDPKVPRETASRAASALRSFRSAQSFADQMMRSNTLEKVVAP